MKFFYAFLSSILLFSVSCTRQESPIETSSPSTHEEQMNDLLASIDSLNAQFGYDQSQTKGGLTNFLTVSAADQLGGLAGAWIGKELGAGLGVITANPVIGVVGYVGGRKVGKWAGGAAASYLAGKFCGGCSVSIDPNDPIQSLYLAMYDNLCQQCALGNSEEATANYSAGEIHNIILAKLATNGKNYTDRQGRVLVPELYYDALQIETEMGFDTAIEYETEFKRALMDYCYSVVSASKEKSLYNESDEVYENKLSLALALCGVEDSIIRDTRAITSKLSAPVDLTLEETISYESKFEDIVGSSKIPADEKEIIRQVGSIAIMSTEYWSSWNHD